MRVVLVTGTSKGLGFEVAKQYVKLGFLVIGISRNKPLIIDENYHHLVGDVTNTNIGPLLTTFIESLAIEKIDIVVNNAGAGSYGCHLSDLEPEEVLSQLNLHCVGALRVIKAVSSYIKGSKIVNVTSRLASISQAVRGDFVNRDFSYGYRIAKCAQNMLSLSLANDTELSNNVIVSINPGLLQTDSGSSDAKFSAKDGALAFIETIDNAKLSGIYHAFGEEALY
ncbi:SDR family NAD(P)-dependent oxidoreductase [Motilimonas sp. 1_MG-2023]|uniref:SDR family NAD(P)-dependent oxidoreductase n=1 Tax=Motilimonas sp. 1_MG-2023 TaxID=3062672 RepID=UPI0026E14615|nr:SDR family NAD(P)-dependent oxidoreductase [Motilimonas sp. 1_MG-2023]MDO6526763.1 SDR family NAD(P)-dependent oxidoreductase [Motilimonas sp. 1_MG-2023]